MINNLNDGIKRIGELQQFGLWGILIDSDAKITLDENGAGFGWKVMDVSGGYIQSLFFNKGKPYKESSIPNKRWAKSLASTSSHPVGYKRTGWHIYQNREDAEQVVNVLQLVLKRNQTRLIRVSFKDVLTTSKEIFITERFIFNVIVADKIKILEIIPFE